MQKMDSGVSLLLTHPDSIATAILYVSENEMISVLPITGTVPSQTEH